jgi:hypothetical protein
MQNDRSVPVHSGPETPEEDSREMADEDADYQWAEYNLPVTPATRPLIEEESSDELAFLGFAVDTDAQPLEN